MKQIIILSGVSISVAALCYYCLTGFATIGLQHASDAYKQIPFDKSDWISAKPEAGKINARAQMKKSVLALFKKGDSIEKIVATLGQPTHRGLRSDFWPGNQEVLPRDSTTFYVYTICLSPEGISDDILFSFSESNELMSIKEASAII